MLALSLVRSALLRPILPLRRREDWTRARQAAGRHEGSAGDNDNDTDNAMALSCGGLHRREVPHFARAVGALARYRAWLRERLARVRRKKAGAADRHVEQGASPWRTAAGHGGCHSCERPRPRSSFPPLAPTPALAGDCRRGLLLDQNAPLAGNNHLHLGGLTTTPHSFVLITLLVATLPGPLTESSVRIDGISLGRLPG